MYGELNFNPVLLVGQMKILIPSLLAIVLIVAIIATVIDKIRKSPTSEEK